MHTQFPQRPFGCLYLLLLFLIPLSTRAQEGLVPEPRLEVEVDPAATLFGGYSFNFGCQFRHFRISARSYSVNEQRFFLGEEPYGFQSSGIGFAFDYTIVRGNTPFVGLQTDFRTEQFFGNTLTGSAVHSTINAGLRVGYRHHFGGADEGDFRGFYFAPTFVFSRQLEGGGVEVDGHVYAPRRFSVQPGLNVGYRF